MTQIKILGSSKKFLTMRSLHEWDETKQEGSSRSWIACNSQYLRQYMELSMELHSSNSMMQIMEPKRKHSTITYSGTTLDEDIFESNIIKTLQQCGR